DPFVGSDHQQHQVNAAYSGQHVAHEAFVSGHVHEAQAQGLATFGGQVQVRETNVNGDAAPFLFFQPVGVNASQRFHQRGFAVINMAGGSDDDGLHGKSVNQRGFVAHAPSRVQSLP